MVTAADDGREAGAQTCSHMTALIDVKAPHHEVSETLVLTVDADPAVVLTAADSLREPHVGVRALGRGAGERLFGMTWRPVPGARIEIVWDIRVAPDGAGGTLLSSTRRFVASDPVAREALGAAWRYVRPAGATIARQTLRAVKRSAEEPAASVSRRELALVA